MKSSIPVSLAFAGLIFTGVLVVIGQAADVDCNIISDCKACVSKKTNVTNSTEGGNNGTCIWLQTSTGSKCSEFFSPNEGIHTAVYTIDGCKDDPPSTTTTTAAPTTTNGTTVAPTTTTVAPTTTNGTTTISPSTTTTTATPTTNATTTTPVTPTNGTTTAAPVTTSAPPSPTPKPQPRGSSFSFASFIGGIVFAAALSSLAYLIFRFYKVRLDRNYHTFSNPTF